MALEAKRLHQLRFEDQERQLYYEFTFIEQFKCNNNPWPWYENREAWKKQLKSSILLTFFNTHILMPVVYYIFETSGLGDEH